MEPEHIVLPSPADPTWGPEIKRIAAGLLRGDIALLPAEGLYGLHACGEAGHHRLLALKQEPAQRPHIILVPSVAAAEALLAPLPAPVSVSVPALGVTATVVPTGVQDDGQMAIPPGRGEAGWYRYGPAVGDDRGSAVIAAHVATPEGKGAFFPLRDSVVGQRVIVTLADGSTREYQVSGRSQWNKAELPVAEVFRPSGDHRLTLVTCGGAFDRDNGRYTDNVVVTAVPVGVK